MKVIIQKYENTFVRAQEEVAALNIPGVKLTVSWKNHILCIHLPQFLEKVQCGMAKYSEQEGESAHASMKRTMARFTINECHLNHGERMKRGVVEWSSERI